MKPCRNLLRLGRSIEHRIEEAQQHAADAYLEQAADHVDLELRIRALDRAPVWIPAYG